MEDCVVIKRFKNKRKKGIVQNIIEVATTIMAIITTIIIAILSAIIALVSIACGKLKNIGK